MGYNGRFVSLVHISRAQRARGGFTLVELLVVIAIILVLGGMLLTGLSRAKQAGLRAQCASNVRQLSMLMLVHATENSDYIPTYVFNTGSNIISAPVTNSPKSDSENSSWTICHKPKGDSCAAHTISVGTPAVLNAHLAHGDHVGACGAADYANCVSVLQNLGLESVLGSAAGVKLVVCPSDKRPEYVTLSDQAGNPMEVAVSYNVNLEFLLTQTRTDRITNPGSTVLLFDGHPSDCVGSYDPAKYNSQYASFRHLARVNVAYVDGHAESLANIPLDQILLQ